jgi:hypothetical protein
MLEGRHFVVFMDHKPLVGALSRVSEPKSDRQRQQLSAIAEFTADIRHIAGQHNGGGIHAVTAASRRRSSGRQVLCRGPERGSPLFGGGSCHTRADRRVLFTFSLSTFTLSTFTLSTFTLFSFNLSILARSVAGSGGVAACGCTGDCHCAAGVPGLP